MRFKWRRHLLVTALMGFTALPFTGCSSSQQQQGSGDEVSASDQNVGEDSAENADASNENSAGEETAATDNGSVPTNEAPVGGDEVVSNDAVMPTNAPATEGEIQEINQEMGANTVAQAAPAEAPAANPVAEVAPPTETVAAQPAAVGGLPETGSKMPYVVEAGDTLGKIATKVYGDQKRWREISGLTGLSNPNHIFPGDVIYYSLDEKSAQFAANYESIKRQKDVVQQGDTLASIAKRIYGSSRSWRHIWRQNDHIDNPDKLEPGTVIYYLEKESIKTASNKNKMNDKVQTAAKKVLKAAKGMSIVKGQQMAFVALTV